MKNIKKITQSLLFFLLFGITAYAQLANWTSGSNPTYTNFPVNVSGQINGACRISQMKFHTTNPNKMYAVTGEGGFFTSTDAGSNWTVKAGTENLTGSCASLCIDYTNDQIIYLGSGDANYYSNGQGVYKSTDGGTTFTATSLTNCLVLHILQDPNNSGTFVAATNKGIYKSTNNGSTWTATTATTLAFCDLKQNTATNSPILYTCTRENSSRYYRSTDFGTTWTQITAGITTASTFITAGARIAVAPSDPNVVYFEAIGGGGIIHKSTDSGLTFSVMKVEGTGTAANPYLTFYDFNNANTLTGQGNYNNCITVDAIDPAKIWLQSHNTWFSSDSGVTWTQLTYWANKVHTDMHQIQQNPFDSTKLYSCNDGGIWLSTDGGNNWVTKSDGLYAYEIYNNCGRASNTDKNAVSIGTQDNGRLFRNASGWFTDRGGDDTRQKEYDYLPNGGNYYEKTQTNRKAANGGSTTATGFPTAGNVWEYLAFNRSNPNLGFMWFTDNKLYRSTNLSAATPTWTNVFTFSVPVTAIHSSISDPNRLYVITNDAKIQVSSNALSATPTFTTYTLPSASNSLASIAAIANNANTVYISINNKVYVSINSGATWTNISYNLPNVNHRKILAEEFGGTQELVFIATNNAVYYKKVGQTTWTIYSTNLPGRRAPTNFTMYDDGTNQAVIRYYTYGRGVWETPFSNLRVIAPDFVASTTEPCLGATVNFTDLTVGNVVTRTWSFPGGTPSTSTALSPSVVYNIGGSYSVTLQVNDGTTTNTITKSAYINLNGSNLPLTESFEGATSPPTGWTNIDNSTQGFKWLKTTSAGGFGLTTSSMIYDNYSYNIVGEKDELQVKKLNLSGLTSASLSFDVAYQVYNGYTDTLAVLISTDCGSTFTSIYSKSGATLSTAGSGTNDFVPLANQWRTETINLTAYIGNPNIVIRFQNTNGFGNKLYLDNVNLSGITTIVSSVGANGSITPNGTVSVITGANQTYNITPNSCYQIADVLVDGVSQGAITSYTFTNVITSHTISATFSQLTFTITASTGTNGSITSSGITSVNCGTSQTYSITPNSCYQIADVLVDGVSQGAITSYTFTNVTTSHTISATFSQLTYTITANAGTNGSITSSGITTVNCGTSQTYTITTNSCYQIEDVLVDGVSQGAITSYTFTNVTSSHTISATFSQLTYTITANAGTNGSITSSGITTVNCGTSQTYTITPNSCYQIADVLVDGVSQGAITSYIFTNVITSHTISASFSQLTYTITASAGTNGSITSSGITTVNCGTSQTYSITPNSCYQIADVVVDGVSQGAITSYIFTNVITSHTISASFSQLTYTITASAGTNGSITPIGVTNVNCGNNQAYTISPNSGFVVQDVLVDGVWQGAITSYTFSNVIAVHTISATFVANAFIITASAGANGSISPSGITSITSGANQSYTITPNSCSQIVTVLVDGINNSLAVSSGSYTFSNVSVSHTISATFTTSSAITYYRDADGDGFGNPTLTTLSCTGQLTGTVLNNTDCNDTNTAINPNQIEILGNGFDDNCNGAIDDIGPTVKVIPSQCGTTLASLWSTIFSTTVATASAYRFEIANGLFVRTFDTSVNRCNMFNFTGVTNGTTYSIRVAAKVGGFWQAFGIPCNITTPPGLASSNVIPSQCGMTITNFWATIFAQQIAGATGYQFEVTDAVNGVRTCNTTANRFSLKGNLVGGAVANTVYTVRVAILYNGVYQPFGSPCTITTSAGAVRETQETYTKVFEVKAFPNPFADNFKLDINTTNENSLEIKVYDMIGKLIESRQVSFDQLSSQELGDRYSSGVYNLVVTQGENVKTLRVIKK